MTLLRSLPASNLTETGGLTAALGLSGADPTWVTKRNTTELQAWLQARWTPEALSFQWETTDSLTMHYLQGGPHYCGDSSLTVELTGLPDSLGAAVLLHVAIDNHEQIKAVPGRPRGVVAGLRGGGCTELTDLSEDDVQREVGLMLRRWQAREDIATADPDLEWQRTVIRTAVIQGTEKNYKLSAGSISQPWLRDLLVNVLKARYPSTRPQTMQKWVREVARLSRFLELSTGDGNTRGQAMRDVSAATMDDFAAMLRRAPDTTDHMQATTLWTVSSVLSQARSLGFADQLPASFDVKPQHHPVMMEQVWQEKAFSDALFSLLLGGAATFTEDEDALAGLSEDGFGQGVLDLAASIPNSEWDGRVFVHLLHTAANYGRRTNEVCSLRANTIQEQPGTGHPGILYANFKSGREAVLLPIDRQSRDALHSWIQELRRRYPNTPLDRLALFPASLKNADGSKPVRANGMARWFKTYVLLLEQAIILGHLHQASSFSLTDLLNLKVGDLSKDDGSLTVAGRRHPLSAWHWQMLIDYLHDLEGRLGGLRFVSGYDAVERWPLFPDPLVQSHVNNRARVNDEGLRIKPSEMIPATTADAFGPLGEDWLTKAASYRSAGLPATHFGEGRINPDKVTFGRFRHTYLQSLVNIGTDIFQVQELADHKSVQTTIDSYVRPQQEKLHEAVSLMQKARVRAYGAPSDADHSTPRFNLPTRSLGGRGGADCENPHVHANGIAGCDEDGNCFDCPAFAIFDPSHLPEINANIATATRTLHKKDAEGAVPGQLDYMVWKRDGWRRVKSTIQNRLDVMLPAEREATLAAAKVIADFRSRVHNEAGITLGAAQ